MLALALLLALAAQVAYGLRGHIAQLSPAWQAAVLQACAHLGCTLPPVRSLQALSVEGSSLSFDDSTQTHRLKVQLHNGSAGPVLLPSLELALLDAEGTVLSRRSLSPAQWDEPRSLLAAGAQAEVGVTLDLAAIGASSIASFRVALFYAEP